MADAGAGVDIIGAEYGAYEFLNEIGFFVRAARGGDAADRVLAIGRLNALEFGGGVGDRFFPGNFFPRIADLGADHRFQNTLAVRRVTEGEAALHAGMAM